MHRKLAVNPRDECSPDVTLDVPIDGQCSRHRCDKQSRNVARRTWLRVRTVTGRANAIAACDHIPEQPVHRALFTSTAACLAVAVAAPLSVSSAQSDIAISPFVSFLPTAGASPLAGLAIALSGNSGFALRGSGNLALENTNTNGFTSANTFRPWGADADLVFTLGGRSYGSYGRSLAPFVFAGIGVSGRDSLGSNVTHRNWSYGAGASIPLGSVLDLFAESRWRMSEYVLPTAQLAPSPTTELRFGLSFHVGTGRNSRSRTTLRPRDRRTEISAIGFKRIGVQ